MIQKSENYTTNMAKRDWRVEVGAGMDSHLRISFLCFSEVEVVDGEVDPRRAKILFTVLRPLWKIYLTESLCD